MGINTGAAPGEKIPGAASTKGLAMLRYFRRKRPTTPTQPSVSKDVFIASAWGMNLDQWNSLSDFDRRECRRLVVTAPRFQS